MRLSLRQQLTGGLLLAVYGGIALLGYGLHELSADDHHHGHWLAVAHDGHHHDGPCSGHHHHEQHNLSADGGSFNHSHDCEICEFLAHAVGEVPQPAAILAYDLEVAEAAISAAQSASQVALGLHAPRGPPARAA